jgi:hypothetical protein
VEKKFGGKMVEIFHRWCKFSTNFHRFPPAVEIFPPISTAGGNFSTSFYQKNFFSKIFLFLVIFLENVRKLLKNSGNT